MILKHADLDIPKKKEENPFLNCKLGREKYARILTSIIEGFADGFVLAINNEWGTGKTTFVKMWQQHLINKEFETLYFNAWENDYDSDPLVAILSELKKLTGDTDNKVFKSVLNNGLKLTKSLFPIILKAIAQKYIEVDGIKEAIGKISEDAVEMFQEEVKEYAAKKDGLIQFKKKLEEYIKKASKGKPVIFIIDELDRCRPDYAVEILEKVKHFFNIPGIVFVLSIDKIQLGNAIRGFYGSEQLNADEYLRRFIDIEFRIPTPNAYDVSKYYYDYFKLKEFFGSENRGIYSPFREDGRSFIEFSSILIRNEKITLRQQEKLFAHARIVLSLFREESYIYPTLFFWLIYNRELNSDLFKKIIHEQITPQDLLEEIENQLLPFLDNENKRTFIYTEGLLLLLYTNDYRKTHLDYKLKEPEKQTGKDKLTIESKIGNEDNALLNLFEKFRTESFYDFRLSQILNKIELLEELYF